MFVAGEHGMKCFYQKTFGILVFILIFKLIETFGNNSSSNNLIVTLLLIIIVNKKMVYSIFEI